MKTMPGRSLSIRPFQGSLTRLIARSLLRHYPVQRGRARITRYLMAHVGPSNLASIEASGFTIALDLRQSPSQQLYWFGAWEPATSRLIRRVLSDGFVGFDIGANVGLTTLEMAKAVGTDGAVHSFEPFAENYRLLESNVRRNHLSDRVTLNQVAVGESPSVLRFASDGDGALAHVAEQGPESQAVTLDEYVASSGVDRIDLIKIDVEGFEMSVLNGAKSTLSTRRPVLIVECAERHLARYDSTPRELLELLSNLGYDCKHSGNPTNENLFCFPRHAR